MMRDLSVAYSRTLSTSFVIDIHYHQFGPGTESYQ